MKSGTKPRRTTRICAVISAGMMLVIGLPACTSASMTAPRAAEHETSTVQQASAAVPEPMMRPLALGDETSKSLPVEQYEEPAGACSDALYIEEPMASGYVQVQVTDALWLICNEANQKCVDNCIKALPAKKRKDKNLQRICEVKCHAEYMVCLERAGLVKKVFNAFDTAWSWIKDHKAAIVGSIVVIGGVAYIVSTAGSGALILIPLGA